MPQLSAFEKHKCLMCQKIISRRSELKKHLTLPTVNGEPRCSGLRKVIPSDIWAEQILPHFTNDTPLPELEGYILSSTGPKRKPIEKIWRDKRSDRLKSDKLLNETGDCKFTKSELL